MAGAPRTSNFYSPEPSVRSSEFGSLYDSSVRSWESTSVEVQLRWKNGDNHGNTMVICGFILICIYIYTCIHIMVTTPLSWDVLGYYISMVIYSITGWNYTPEVAGSKSLDENNNGSWGWFSSNCWAEQLRGCATQPTVVIGKKPRWHCQQRDRQVWPSVSPWTSARHGMALCAVSWQFCSLSFSSQAFGRKQKAVMAAAFDASQTWALVGEEVDLQLHEESLMHRL